jgi:hypothetical protein
MHNAVVEKFQTSSRPYIKTMQELALISDEVWFTLNTNINSQNNTGSCSSFYMTKSVWCAVNMHKIIGPKLYQEKHSGHYVQLILAPYFMELTEKKM